MLGDRIGAERRRAGIRRDPRGAYPFVALLGRAAHIFSTQDVFDQVKADRGDSFTYSFRDLQYYSSTAVHDEPFVTLPIIDMAPAGAAHNDDLLVGHDGRTHLLYTSLRDEYDWNTQRPLGHAFGPPGGPFTHVAVGIDHQWGEGRFWEAPDGTIYVHGAYGSGVAGGAPYLKGLYELPGEDAEMALHYFRMDPSLGVGTAVTEPLTPPLQCCHYPAV